MLTALAFDATSDFQVRENANVQIQQMKTFHNDVTFNVISTANFLTLCQNCNDDATKCCNVGKYYGLFEFE